MRNRERRFKGRGNFAYGDGPRHPAWKVNCSYCDAIKVLGMPTGPWPPDAVIKRLVQAGWHVGKSPEEDLCPSCIMKQRERKEKEQHEEIYGRTNGMPRDIDKNTGYILPAQELSAERAFICRIHAMLVDGQVEQAMETIERHLPSWPLRSRLKQRQEESSIALETKRAAEQAKKKYEDDFASWLAQEEEQHRHKQ